MLKGYHFYDMVNLSFDAQNCTLYERTSVKDEILELQKKFSEATQRFEVCHIQMSMFHDQYADALADSLGNNSSSRTRCVI